MPKKSSGFEEVVALAKTKFQNVCGIVYCISQKDCEDCARVLKSNNFKAVFYHAGMTDDKRIKNQNAWLSGKVSNEVLSIQ